MLPRITDDVASSVAYNFLLGPPFHLASQSLVFLAFDFDLASITLCSNVDSAP